MLPLPAANPYRIMAVGDSITAGYTDNPKWTVPFEFGYRAALYTRLTNSGMTVQFVGGSPEPWDGRYGLPTNAPSPDLRIIGQAGCEGYGGKRTPYVLEHIASWLKLHSPDVVLLMIGINDIGTSATEPFATEQNLSNIVATVVSTAPDTRLIVAQITPRSTYTHGLKLYNDFIRDTLVPHFAGQGKHVTTVDQYTNFLVPGTTNSDAALFSNGINHPNAAGYDRMARTWFDGIRALSLPAPRPPRAANILTNGGFEAPLFALNSHNINPAGTAWVFTSGASGAGSGIDRGDPYGNSGSTPVEGAQQAVLQSSGNSSTSSISLVVPGLAPGQSYQLSFCAKGTSRFLGSNPFRVRLREGTNVTYLFHGTDVVPATNYNLYVSQPFRTTGSTVTLEFVDHGLSTVEKVSWIDSVSVIGLPGVVVSASIDGGQFRLRFNGDTNFNYHVMASTNLSLAANDWSAVGWASWVSNDVFEFRDPGVQNRPRRFFRVQIP